MMENCNSRNMYAEKVLTETDKTDISADLTKVRLYF